MEFEICFVTFSFMAFQVKFGGHIMHTKLYILYLYWDSQLLKSVYIKYNLSYCDFFLVH